MNTSLWTPSVDRIKYSEMTAFMQSMNREHKLQMENYQDLHQFSITHKDLFWKSLINYFGVNYSGALDPVLLEEGFSNYTWFSNVELNFAENLLKNGKDGEIALNFQHESGMSKKVSYKHLRTEVKCPSVLSKKEYVRGGCTCAYMPNIPETVVSMLAALHLVVFLHQRVAILVLKVFWIVSDSQNQKF